MKTGLCLISMALCALSAAAQVMPPPPPAPAGATPEEAAAHQQAVAALRIRSSDLLRRAPTTNNTLVVAGAPESPVVLMKTTTLTPGATAATPNAVKPPPQPTAGAGGPPPSPPPPTGPGADQPPAPPMPPPPGAKAETPGMMPPGPPAKATFDTGPVNPNEPIEFDWMNADISQVLAKYSELTRRSAIMQQGLQGLVTFRSSGPLTLEEAIGALESVLLVNGYAIVPMGEKFFKVSPSTTGTMEGIPVSKDTATVPQFDRIIAHIVRVKYLDVTDVARALGGAGAMAMPGGPPTQPGAMGMGRVFMHPYGQIIPMPRSNALLLIDTALNVSRLKEIIEYMDTTSETKMETRVYVLENADALSVYRVLQSLVAADQGVTTAAAAAPGMPGQPTPFAGTGSSRRLTTSIEESVLLGRVLMNYDERTNAIILITQEVNFAFFEKIIKALDVKTNQDFKTRVFFLNYADALEMSDMLYRFVQGSSPTSTGAGYRPGGVTGGTTSRTGTSTRGTTGSSRGGRTSSVARGTSSRSTAAARSTFGSGARMRATTPTPTAPTGAPTPGMPGALAQQLIEIIPDQRNNAIVVFAPQADLETIADIIKQLDVFPPQVHIDVVVAEVTLTGNTTFGIDLFQKVQGGNAARGGGISTPDGGSLTGQALLGKGNISTPGVNVPNSGTPEFGTGTSTGGALSRLIDSKTLTSPEMLTAGGLTGGLSYFATFFANSDLRAVITALASDNNFKVLQTPGISIGNASPGAGGGGGGGGAGGRIFVGQSRPFVTSTLTDISGQVGTARSNYENIDIGVGLELTALINPDGVVTLNIYQTVDDVAGFQRIDNNDIPILNRREIEIGAMTVKDGQIILLGGLTTNSRRKTESKVPVVGDIPLLGNLFKKTTWDDTKLELVFFLRPKVIRTVEEAQRYAWSRLEKSKDIRTMPIRDVEGYSPLMDKRYSKKLKALEQLDKSDKF